MKSSKVIFALLTSAILSSCASMSGWHPIIDPKLDAHPEAVQRDMAECKQLADQASDVTKEVGMGAGVGALGGAATGAAVGAVVGSAATGAALGSIVAIPAGMYEGWQSNEDFKRSFKTCMRQRGHTLVN